MSNVFLLSFLYNLEKMAKEKEHYYVVPAILGTGTTAIGANKLIRKFPKSKWTNFAVLGGGLGTGLGIDISYNELLNRKK